jgi:hypothetical protein
MRPQQRELLKVRSASLDDIGDEIILQGVLDPWLPAFADNRFLATRSPAHAGGKEVNR